MERYVSAAAGDMERYRRHVQRAIGVTWPEPKLNEGTVVHDVR